MNARVVNTDPKTFSFIWHVDVRHEYLEVPKNIIEETGLTKEISHYSFVKGDVVFLEGDVDAAKLIDTLNDQGHLLEFEENVIQGESVINRYDRYTA